MSMEEVSDDERPAKRLDKGKGKASAKLGDANAVADEAALPWVEKYRPKALEDVVSHQDIIATLNKFVENNRLPHLLFYGPPGTGKTSMVLALARKVFGSSYKNQILELNASDDRGIDVVREQIKTFASTRQIFSSNFKLIILDEADAMTLVAQGALRRVIEQYTKNVRFCIICNYVNKIAPALQSRCTRFRFQPLPEEQIERKVDEVILGEQINIDAEGKAALLKLSRGDMRRALNVLQACATAYTDGPIDETAIYNCVGNPHPTDIDLIVQSTMNDELTTALRVIAKMKTEKGLALQDILQGVFEELENLDLKPPARAHLYDKLAGVEYRLSMGGSEKIQTSAMIAAIKQGVDLQAR
ncbi:Subunit of heteropentameric Replication factor C (RF-C) [Savitreella phatthalungensis]